MGTGDIGRGAAAALMLLTAPACPSATFQCSDDVQCPQGSCIDGACAFADDDCASGMRFGAYSAGGLGGTCVPVADDTSSTIDPGSDGQSASAGSTGSSTGGLEESTGGPTTTGIGSASTSGGVGMTATTEPEESSSSGPPPDPDLVAYFPCEGEGPMIGLDASGHGHDGVCESCPSSVEGVFGQACAFDGTQAFSVPFDAAFSLEELTIAAWLLPDALPDDRLMSAAGVPSGVGHTNAYQFGFNGLGTNDLVFFCSGPPKDPACINESIVLGEWVHVAVTSSPQGVRMYFDGVLVREGAASFFAHQMGEFLVGLDMDDDAPAHEFEGRIDELRLYSRALSDGEVEALAFP